MKNKVFAFAILVMGMATTASAQSSDFATVTASADIVTPISIAPGNDMSFGKIVATAAGGTVDVDFSGSLTATGVVKHSSAVGSAASFTVSGEDGFTYDVTLPTTFDLAGPTGSTAMTVNNFSHNATGTLTGGTETFDVAATLTVGANQVPGAYTNSTDFTVTVAYN